MAEKKSDVDNFTERRLLQTLFYQPEFLEDPSIDDGIFSSSATRNVYKAVQYLKEHSIPFTRDALLQEYAKIDIDGSPNVIDIITAKQNQPLTSIKDIVKQLQDAKKRRKAAANLKAAALKIEEQTHLNEHNIIDIKDLIGAGEEELFLEDHSIKKVMDFEEWAEQYNKELNLRKKGKQFYFYNFIFDELIPDGPRPGEIGIIASSSGSGKSTLSLNLINSLIEAQIPSMYFSLEMSSIATMDRLMSKRLEILYSDIINPREQGQFEDICDMLEKEKLHLSKNKTFRFSEDASMTLNELRKYIKKFQSEMGQRYCIVVLDLLSMVSDFTKVSGGTNFAQSVELGMNKLSAIAKELGVHIIGVLQLNRTTESDVKCHDVKDLQRFRPNRAQIKNASAWVERSRYVLTTFREKMYAELYLQPDQYDTLLDIIEVQAVKISNGRIGKTAKGLFNGAYFDVSALPEEQAPTNP